MSLLVSIGFVAPSWTRLAEGLRPVGLDLENQQIGMPGHVAAGSNRLRALTGQSNICQSILLCVVVSVVVGVGGCCWFGPETTPLAPDPSAPDLPLSLSPPHVRSFCLSLDVFSLNFGGVFEGRGPSNVHVLGSRAVVCGGFGAPTETPKPGRGGPTLWGPTLLRSLLPSGPHLFWFWTPLGVVGSWLLWLLLVSQLVWTVPWTTRRLTTLRWSADHLRCWRTGSWGFTRQPKNSKRAHFKAPALQTPPKFHEKTSKETQKEQNGGEGKRANFLAGPHPSGAHLLGPRRVFVLMCFFHLVVQFF